MKPVLICPQALTNLLKIKGVIENEPREHPGPRDFEPPTYDITNDMLQASSTIADGLTEEFRRVVKRRLRILESAQRINFQNIGSRLNSFASFLGALGPGFSIFGGVTSIITTYLTPNPFDEMVKYLDKEFDEVHRRLSHLQNDIADFKRVVQAENKVVAMTRKLAAIRYSLRKYKRVVDSLSKDPVCGSNNLLERSEVKEFMRQYRSGNVEDSLLDLYGVEYGEVLEASSLLKPFMRAYCGTNPAKVQRFMHEISNYAYAGSLAHFAFKSLDCLKDRRRDCDNNEEEKQQWMRKLYRFLKKANNIKEAAINPVRGLHLDMKDDLDKLIYDEVKKAPNVDAKKFPGLFDKVYNFIINKLYSVNDWPEACIVNLKNDRTVIISVAQTNARVYGSDFKPWALDSTKPRVRLDHVKFKIKSALRGSTKKELDVWSDFLLNVFCKPDLGERCVVRSWYDIKPPAESSEDRIIYFLFNPKSYLFSTNPDTARLVPATPDVVINMFPIDVYYTQKSFMQRGVGDTKIVVGCWQFQKDGNIFSCRAPTRNDPNRATWDKERYIAIIAE